MAAAPACSRPMRSPTTAARSPSFPRRRSTSSTLRCQAAWSRGNPVDMLGDAKGDRYTAALEALLADRGRRRGPRDELPDGRRRQRRRRARRGRRRRESAPRAAILTCWLGDAAAEESRRLFAAQPAAELRDAERGGPGADASRQLQAQPGPTAGDAASRSPSFVRPTAQRRARSFANVLADETDAADRAGSEGAACRASASLSSRPCRGTHSGGGRGARAEDRRAGRGQDPVARHHAQVRCRRRPAQSSLAGGRWPCRARHPCDRRRARAEGAASPASRCRRW